MSEITQPQEKPPIELTDAQRKSGLGIVFLTIFIDLVGFGIVIPLIPTYVTRLDASPSSVGFIMASFTLMQFLFNPVLGRLSDQYGRRPFILIGLLGSFFSYMMFAIAGNIWVLLASRLLAGIFNANVAVGQAYIADITKPEDRAKGMGLIGAAFGMGFTFGPAIGGVAGWAGDKFIGSPWGFTLPGLVAAGFSLLAFLWAWARLVESHPPERRGETIQHRKFTMKNLRKVFGRPLVGWLLGLFFLEVFAFANFESSFVLYGDMKWQFTKLQAGLYLGYAGIMSALIQGLLIGRLTKRFGEMTLLKAGFLFLGVGLAILPLGHSSTSLLISVLPLAFGMGLINPTIPSIISKLCTPEERGGVMGLSQSLGSLGRIVGQPYGTVTFQYIGMAAPFYSGAVIMLLGFVVALGVVRPVASSEDNEAQAIV